MNVFWLVFYGMMNMKPQLRNLWRKPNHEDMKIIFKEGVDKGGCKGESYVCEISSLMKNFKDQS